MARPLHVLIIEDSEDDTELELEQLRRAAHPLEFRRVDSLESLNEALDHGPWDLIISDFSMPHLTAPEAIKIVRDRGFDTPFIIVSGSVGEDIAVTAMRAGANDYFRKENMVRLPVAVERELRDAMFRRQNRRGQAAMRVLASIGPPELSEAKGPSLLQSIAKATVAELADVCIIDIKPVYNDTLECAALETTNPAIKDRVEKATPRHSLGVIDEEKTHVPVTEIPDVRAHTAVGATEHSFMEIAQAAGLASGAIYRLMGREGLLGIVTFGSREELVSADFRNFDEIAARIQNVLENVLLYRKLEDAVKVRDDFMSIASHELRTPLQILRLQLQMLQNSVSTGGSEPFGARGVQGLTRSLRQVDRLRQLVDTMLEVTRIQNDRFELETEEFDLAELARDLTALYTSEANRQQISFEHAGPTLGVWDHSRMESVLTNLLSNAVKFGDGKPIRVHLIGSESNVTITVEDQGVGIQRSEQQRIFRAFERAVPASHFPGLGIGLWITHKIVEAHGGQIGLRSEPERGSTFIVILPRFPSARCMPSQSPR